MLEDKIDVLTRRSTMPMHTTRAPSGLANLCRCEFNLVPLLDVTEIVNSCTSAATTQDCSSAPEE